MIVNYYTCTRNFKEKFVEELMLITEEMNAEREKEEMKAYTESISKLTLNKSKSGKEQPQKPKEKEAKEEKTGLLKSLFGGKKNKK